MEINLGKISSDSTKQEFLSYLNETFKPINCIDPKHKFQFSEICFDAQSASENPHCIYQLLCIDCKSNDHYHCKEKFHKTAQFVGTLRQLIEQIEPDPQLQNPHDAAAAALDQCANQTIKLLNIVSQEIQEMKLVLENQITELTKQKKQLENDLKERDAKHNQRMMDFKQLLALILTQDNSQYCQQYVSQLNEFTDIDNTGRLMLNLFKGEKKDDEQFKLSLGQEQLESFAKNVNEWSKERPNLLLLIDDNQIKEKSQVLSVFSYLLNEFKMPYDLKLILMEADKYNQRNLKLPIILCSSCHKQSVKIDNIEECIKLMVELCKRDDLDKKYQQLIKFLLGFCYFYGIGFQQKNEREGFKMYQQSEAAKVDDQGYAVAQDRIALCYLLGKGVKKNLNEGFNYYIKGAKQCHPNCLNGLGYCYNCGMGVERSQSQAIKYYKKAAEQRYPIAEKNLANSYYYGWGVQKDLTLAIKYYRLAADQGYHQACYHLATCYENGAGIQQNLQEAQRLYQRAADLGNENAKTALDNMHIGDPHQGQN